MRLISGVIATICITVATSQTCDSKGNCSGKQGLNIQEVDINDPSIFFDNDTEYIEPQKTQYLDENSYDRLIIETLNYIPDEFEADLRTLIDCQGGSGADSRGTDYVVYERMFTESFLMGLYDEMRWLEKHYEKDFIDSQVKRNNGPPSQDGDYKNYHRVSKVYWLTFVKEEDYKYLPNLLKFKDWIKLLKAAINKQLYEAGEDFEVSSIEEQYIYYQEGGKFEAHLDTQCNPLRDCQAGKPHHYPRLFTWLIFLNPGWTDSDGGFYKTYYNWPKLDVKEVVTPTLGKTVMIRADKVYHSAEYVNTEKRAISLFINVKPVTTELPTYKKDGGYVMADL